MRTIDSFVIGLFRKFRLSSCVIPRSLWVKCSTLFSFQIFFKRKKKESLPGQVWGLQERNFYLNSKLEFPVHANHFSSRSNTPGFVTALSFFSFVFILQRNHLWTIFFPFYSYSPNLPIKLPEFLLNFLRFVLLILCWHLRIAWFKEWLLCVRV